VDSDVEYQGLVLNHLDSFYNWQSNGTGYTLVSEVGGRSCLVCHTPAEKVEEAIPNRARSPAHL
jgi:hypothetical protein